MELTMGQIKVNSCKKNHHQGFQQNLGMKFHDFSMITTRNIFHFSTIHAELQRNVCVTRRNCCRTSTSHDDIPWLVLKFHDFSMILFWPYFQITWFFQVGKMFLPFSMNFPWHRKPCLMIFREWLFITRRVEVGKFGPFFKKNSTPLSWPAKITTPLPIPPNRYWHCGQCIPKVVEIAPEAVIIDIDANNMMGAWRFSPRENFFL